MTLTKVHLLRHGEVHNPEGVLYGRLPGYRLSERGEQMAMRVAEAVAERDVVRLVSSPLERAQQTAAPIAEKLGLDVVTDDRVIEAENIFEGLTFGVGDGSLRHVRHWKHLRNPFRPSWGEPYVDQVERIRAAMDDAAAVRKVMQKLEQQLAARKLRQRERRRSNRNTRNAWSLDTLSLAAYAGQTVVLRFMSTTDSIYRTAFWVDDVSLR